MNSHERFTILLVQPEGPERNFLSHNLTADGYEVVCAATSIEGHDCLQSEFPDAALIDARLPDGGALALVTSVRHADGVASRLNPVQPLLIFGTSGTELDSVRAFERGADDVIAVHAAYRELRCRIEALLRRSEARGRGGGRLRVADLELDTVSRIVRLGGDPLDLSAKEFALLRVLAADPVRVFTKAELLRSVWGQHAIGTTRTLDSHACRLRRKLGVDGGRFVINVWGVGYRLVDAPALAEVARPLAAVA